MSATAFLRHRRAVAAKYVQAHAKKHGSAVAAMLEARSLAPSDLETLDKNNDVLAMADELAAAILDEPELDSLEEVNAITVGDRADVHSPDVSEDQFENKLQHPSAETVGVGNMHDGPEAAEALANVSRSLIDDNDGSLAAAAKAAATDGLADHAGLPAVHPSMAPAADATTAEDDRQPTDPTRTQEGMAATPIDQADAAKALAEQQKAAEGMVAVGESALGEMDRDQLLAYAEGQNIVLGDVKPATKAPAIRKWIETELTKRSDANV